MALGSDLTGACDQARRTVSDRPAAQTQIPHHAAVAGVRHLHNDVNQPISRSITIHELPNQQSYLKVNRKVLKNAGSD